MINDDRKETECFPVVDCKCDPKGNRIIVQLRKERQKSSGGIVLVEETKVTQKYNEIVAKVVKIGPLAYHDRDFDTHKLVPWAEGPWCKVGDYVRTIKWNGDRWSIKVGEKDFVNFITINDKEIISVFPDFESCMSHISFVD